MYTLFAQNNVPLNTSEERIFYIHDELFPVAESFTSKQNETLPLVLVDEVQWSALVD